MPKSAAQRAVGPERHEAVGALGNGGGAACVRAQQRQRARERCARAATAELVVGVRAPHVASAASCASRVEPRARMARRAAIRIRSEFGHTRIRPNSVPKELSPELQTELPQ